MRNIIVLVLLAFAIPTYGASCYEVSVEVDATKSNGGDWEWHGGKPDLQVCIYDSWGKRCKAKGKGKKYTKAYCQDSLDCNLGVIRFIDNKAGFEVINVNRAAPDGAIDFGQCEIGKECKLGNATFKFKEASCD